MTVLMHFRGKHKDTKEWIEWINGYCVHAGRMHLISHRTVKNYKLSAKKIIPSTLGWYIGKRDIYKSQIFVGDIVHAVENKRYIDKFGVVEWKKGECRHLVNTGGDWLTMDDYDWKVIGNIYDNPELLEAAKP